MAEMGGMRMAKIGYTGMAKIGYTRMAKTTHTNNKQPTNSKNTFQSSENRLITQILSHIRLMQHHKTLRVTTPIQPHRRIQRSDLLRRLGCHAKTKGHIVHIVHDHTTVHGNALRNTRQSYHMNHSHLPYLPSWYGFRRGRSSRHSASPTPCTTTNSIPQNPTWAYFAK